MCVRVCVCARARAMCSRGERVLWELGSLPAQDLLCGSEQLLTLSGPLFYPLENGSFPRIELHAVRHHLRAGELQAREFQASPIPILEKWAGTTLPALPALPGIRGGPPPPLPEENCLFQQEELGGWGLHGSRGSGGPYRPLTRTVPSPGLRVEASLSHPGPA